MTWYPQDPVDKANHFLKDRQDPQHQLKDQMWHHHGLKHASEAHNPVVKDEGQQAVKQPEDLYAKQARLEEQFARLPYRTGLTSLQASQPAGFYLPPKEEL